MTEKRVRVGVRYGDNHLNLAGHNYTYLVRPEQANIGQTLIVPVTGRSGTYLTRATVVTTEPTATSKEIRNPKRAR